MAGTDVPVTLTEATEFRGSLLSENEAWGVLSQAAESVQDLFIKGTAFSAEGLAFVITPGTLLLNSSGRVSFMAPVNQDCSYLAPEYQEGMVASDGAVDKMYVYSLGRTLHKSTAGNLTHSTVPKLSRNLESLFGAMCEPDPNQRLALVHVLEACSLHAESKSSRSLSSNYVMRLHQQVFGAALNNSMFDSSYGSDISSLTVSTEMTRRRRSRSREGRRQRKTSNRSRSRSRSRSDPRKPKEPDYGFYRRKSNPDRDSGIGTLREADYNARVSQSISEVPSSLCVGAAILNSENQDPRTLSKQTPLPQNFTNELPKGLVGQQIIQPRAREEYPQGQYPVGYEKYLWLKERQRRLRAIRNHGDDRPLSFRRPGEAEVATDNKSLHSLLSYSAGTYMLDPRYGPEGGYRMGVGSDQESLSSTDVSMMADTNPLRASKTTINSTLPKAPGRKKPDRHVTVNPPVNREFIGPEFVHNAAKPPIRIPMPLQGESLKNPTHARRVILVHLTGQRYEVICDPSTNGRQLFDGLVTHIGLTEYYYFGLTYVSETEHFFIDPDTKLHKVAPEGWKETVKGHPPVVTFTVYVRVKFYLDSITDIRHDSTYHLMYLQLRRDIIEDRFYCTDEQATALAGLALQVEFGDYNPVTMEADYYVPEQYFSSRVIRKVGVQNIREQGFEMHRSLHGHPSSQSELEFVKCIQKLPEYGIHYHKLLRNKNDSMSTVWVGVACQNLVLSESQGHERLIVQRHPWNAVQKISFNKRRFSVQPKPEAGRHKPQKINLYSNTYRKGRYLLQMCTAQHRFQMRMRTRPSNTETLHGEDSAVGIRTSLISSGLTDTEDNMVDELSNVDHRSNSGAYDSSLDTGSIRFVPDIKSQEPPAKYLSPPPYRPGLSYSMDDIRDQSPTPLHVRQGWCENMAVSNMELSRPDFEHDNLHDNQDNIDVEREEELQPTSKVTYKKLRKLPESEEALLSSPSPLGRRITEVTLRKEDPHGIGLTIVGGETVEKLDLGIFVKTVVPRGPAHRSGRVMPGDRIIAINSQSLEGLHHRDAVRMIRDSGSDVKLLVSQVHAPRTLRRRNVETELSDELNAELDEIARSHEELYSNSLGLDVHNKQLSKSLDNLVSSTPPQKPPRKYRDNQVPPVQDILQEFSGGRNQSGLVSEKREGGVIVKADIEHVSLRPEDILSGNLVYRDESRLASSIDVSEEAARLDNLDLLDNDSVCSQELEFVGEMAQMTMNDSSSDSDFDSAIHDVVEGRPRKPSLSHDLSHDTDGSYIDTGQTGPTDDSIWLKKSISDFYSYIDQDDVYELEMTKGTNGLGFSIQGGVDVHSTDPSQCIPRVKKIFAWGPAAESQVIRAGDVILQVDHQQLRGLSRNEIIEMMHTTPKTVKLVMFRPDPSILPPIEHGDSMDSLQALLNSPQAQLSAATLVDNQDSDSNDSTLHSGRSSPEIPCVNRLNAKQDLTVTSPDSVTTPILRRSWTDQVIVTPPHDSSGRDGTGVLTRSQSEQNTLLPAASPPVASMDKYFTEDKKSGQVSNKSPYGNFENLAMLGSSDDLGGQDSSAIDSDWSDVELTAREQGYQPLENSGAYRSPLIEPRNSTLLSELEKNSDVWGSNEVEREKPPKLRPVSNTSSISDEHDVTLRDPNVETDYKDIDSRETTGDGLQSTGITDDGSQSRDITLGDFDFSVESFESSANRGLDTKGNSGQTFSGEVTVERQGSNTDLKSGEMDKSVPISNNVPPYLRRQVNVNSDDEHASVNNKENFRNSEQITVNNGLSDVNSRNTKRQIVNDELSGGNNQLSNANARNANNEIVNGQDVSETSSKTKRGSGDSNFGPGEFELMLRKRDGGGLGFAVAGSGQSKTGCYVKDVLQDPALSDGRLKPGDQLIEVNGHCMLNLDHFEAVTLLRQAPVLVRIKARRPVADSPQTTTSQPAQLTNGAMTNKRATQDTARIEAPPQVDGKTESVKEGEKKRKNKIQDLIRSLEDKHLSSDSDTDSRSSYCSGSESGLKRIRLQKPVGEGFGFSLVTADNGFTTGVHVKTIRSGGVAHKDGRLQVGDRLIQVNSESVIGLNHTKVVALLRETKDEVVLTVARQSQKLDSYVKQEEQEKRFRTPGGDDSFSRLIDPAHETDEDINSLASDAEDFLKQNGNTSNISLYSSKDESHSVATLKYRSPRKLAVHVPEILTDDWLESIPVVSITEDGQDYISEALHSLVEKVEQDEPFEEFKNLRVVKATDESVIANKPENKVKNRYRNVLPYDYNRVKLEEDDDEQEDYINASHIKLSVENETLWYITGQGPLPETVEDFWMMCWQQNVTVIAMLTLDVESMKVKCHRYWPQSDQESISVCNGKYSVSSDGVQTSDDYIIRYIQMKEKMTGKVQRIVHLNYITWPDHGTPDTALPLLQFIRVLHLLHAGGPIVVHCSAGIGRSGTLITIDIALLHMELMKQFKIYDIVAELRRQRYGVIQTKDQYMFCYTACMQALLSVAR